MSFQHEAVRTDIVKVARERFQHYGVAKTNLEEIASDLGMSAGNLYRYFASKQEIAIACSRQLLNEWMAELRDITQDPQLTAADRLRTYALSILSHSQAIASDPTRNNELVELMTTGCPDLICNKFTQQLNILGTILMQGNHNGEFSITNVYDKAKTVHTALLILDAPGFITLFSEKAWRERVIALVDLLINELSTKQ